MESAANYWHLDSLSNIVGTTVIQYSNLRAKPDPEFLNILKLQLKR